MHAHEYDSRFFDYIEEGSRRSARTIIPIVTRALEIHSVLDVGCGRGAWLAVWKEVVEQIELMGIDGDYVDRHALAIPEAFRARDLAQSFDLKRKFDLVQSLEVAEHLPSHTSELFVRNLTRHGDVVLFSAAQPGQGGEHHTNERPLEYWRNLFAAQGLDAYDWLRPQIADCKDVEPWYRYNTILFVRRTREAVIPPAIRATRVDDGQPIRNIVPLRLRAARFFLRFLSPAGVTRLAVMKHRWVLGRRAGIGSRG